MKLPIPKDLVAVLDEPLTGPYPPKGFVPIASTDFGNGDYMGYYWPLGKEAEPPLICRMVHDDYFLVPSWSSVESLISTLNAVTFKSAEPAVPSSLAPLVESAPGEELPEGSGAARLAHAYLFFEALDDPSLEEDPRSPVALLRAAVAAVDRQDDDAALSHLELAVQVLPEFTEAWNRKAQIHRRRREPDHAAECILRALRCPCGSAGRKNT